jgi:hypothetical protein
MSDRELALMVTAAIVLPGRMGLLWRLSCLAMVRDRPVLMSLLGIAVFIDVAKFLVGPDAFERCKARWLYALSRKLVGGAFWLVTAPVRWALRLVVGVLMRLPMDQAFALPAPVLASMFWRWLVRWHDQRRGHEW